MYIWSILTELGGCSPPHFSPFFQPPTARTRVTLIFIRLRRTPFIWSLLFQLCFTGSFFPPPRYRLVLSLYRRHRVFPPRSGGGGITSFPLFQVYAVATRLYRGYSTSHTKYTNYEPTYRYICGWRRRGASRRDSFAFSSTLSLSSFFYVLRWQPLRWCACFVNLTSLYLFFCVSLFASFSFLHSLLLSSPIPTPYPDIILPLTVFGPRRGVPFYYFHHHRRHQLHLQKWEFFSIRREYFITTTLPFFTTFDFSLL